MEENKKRLKAKALFKHELEVNWLKSSYIPEEGEMVLYDAEIDENGNVLELPENRTEPIDHIRFKFGDGKKSITDLDFVEDVLIEIATKMAEEMLLPNMKQMDIALEQIISSDLYYVSEHNLKTFFGDVENSSQYYGLNRVYVERSRDRGPYNMFSLNEKGNKVYHFIYAKSEWLTKFLTEHPGETLRAPYDDEYPLLNSIAQRTTNGDVLVPSEPSSDNAAISKKYAQQQMSASREQQNVIKGYTPGDIAVGINKTANPSSWKSVNTTFQTLNEGGPYYIFETDAYMDVLAWGAAGIQFNLYSSQAAWLMLNGSVSSAIHNVKDDNANRKLFTLDETLFLNKYVHIKFVYYHDPHAFRRPSYSACYLNGVEVARQDRGGAAPPSRIEIGITKDCRGRFEFSNTRAYITNDINADVSAVATTNFDITKVDEELSTLDTWALVPLKDKNYLINKQALEIYSKEALGKIGPPKNDQYDQVYTRWANSTKTDEHYYVSKTGEPIPAAGIEYSKNCGLFKSRYPEQTIIWKEHQNDLSSYLKDPTAESGALAKIETSNTYNDNVLVLTKNTGTITTKFTITEKFNISSNGGTYYGCEVKADVAPKEDVTISALAYIYVGSYLGDYTIYSELGSGTFKARQTKATVTICTMSNYYDKLAPSLDPHEWVTGSSVSFNPDEVQTDIAAGSGDKFVFYPTGLNKGKKFVFETEISWGGYSTNVGSGNWCARMRFIDSGSNSMWYTDNDCDIGFSGSSISIGPDAMYIAANKLVTTSTWALLRVEMIDKTMVVFVNDKEVYRKTNTRNRSTLNSTLGGFRVEFREAVRRTTFYFNNTYVGAVDENYFGRTRTSIPQRLEDGNINVPESPTSNLHAASKGYVDLVKKVLQNEISAKGSTINQLADEHYTLQRQTEQMRAIMGQLEDILYPPTEGLTFEDYNGEYICTGSGTATNKDKIIVPSHYNGIPVVGLKENCFRLQGLDSLVLPATIKHIWGGALYHAAKKVLFKNYFRGDHEGEFDCGETIIWGEDPRDGNYIYEPHFMFDDNELEVRVDDVMGFEEAWVVQRPDTYTEHIYVRMENYDVGSEPWGASKAQIHYCSNLITL